MTAKIPLYTHKDSNFILISKRFIYPLLTAFFCETSRKKVWNIFFNDFFNIVVRDKKSDPSSHWSPPPPFLYSLHQWTSLFSICQNLLQIMFFRTQKLNYTSKAPIFIIVSFYQIIHPTAVICRIFLIGCCGVLVKSCPSEVYKNVYTCE